MPTAISLACFNPPDRFGRKLRYGVALAHSAARNFFKLWGNALFSFLLQKQAQKHGEEPAHSCTTFAINILDLAVETKVSGRRLAI